MNTRTLDGSRPGRLTAVLLGMTIALSGCGEADDGSRARATQAAEEPFAIDLDASGKSELRLETGDGRIYVRGGSADAIHVEGVRRVNAPGLELALAHLGDIEVDTSTDGDVVNVSTRHPAAAGAFSYSVDYEVTLPKAMRIEVASAHGDLDIVDVDGSVQVDTVRGKVTLFDVRGDLDLSVTQGHIAAWAELPASAHVNLAVQSGPLWLALPAASSAVVTASSRVGVSVADLPLHHVTASEGSLSATLGAGQAQISLVASERISLAGY